MKHFNLKLYVTLLLAGVAGAAAVLPYVFTTSGFALAADAQLAGVAALQLLQATVLLAVAVFLGTLFYKEAGLSVPYVEALLAGKKRPAGFWKTAGVALLAGVAVSLVVIFADAVLFGTAIGSSLSRSTQAPVWQRLLATLYGGVDEELLMRFFLMTVLAWLLLRAWKDKKKTAMRMWTSIVLTALIFGAGHLPFTASVVSLTWIIVIRALLLNGIGGAVFGWLFWKRGLESAMIAHFAADVVLLILLPLVVPAIG
ncbi:MAG: CPBP family intramembrane metalloprotease [Candidatus Peribacteraceae bacterium]|nr:CPBP family intramembrane metalloprotease [Candidatus Peribacteraceae bacterium]